MINKIIHTMSFKISIILVLILALATGFIWWKYPSVFGADGLKCTPNIPTITLIPTSGLAQPVVPVPKLSVAPGQSINFDVSVKNNDYACAAEYYDLSGIVPDMPSGWKAQFNYPYVIIGSGYARTAIMTVTPPFDASGSYNIGAMATGRNSKLSSSGNSNILEVKVTGLVTTLTMDKASYTIKKNSTSPTATVTYTQNGMPMKDIQAEFKLAYPDGSSQNVYTYHFTDRFGQVKWKFPIWFADPKGTYVVTVSMLDRGYPIAGAMTTFQVQ